MTSDPIDKVAEAIWIRHGVKMHQDGWDSAASYVQDEYRALAIAALRAIREPTDEMKRAAEAAIDDYHAGDSLRYDEIGRIFTAAIDKALET